MKKLFILAGISIITTAIAQTLLPSPGMRQVKLTFDYPINAEPSQFVLRYIAATNITGFPAPTTNWTGMITIPGNQRIFTVNLPIGTPFFLFCTAENTNGGWAVSEPSNIVTILGSPSLLRLQ